MDNIAIEYDYYTLEQAEKILTERENRRVERRKRLARKSAIRFLKVLPIRFFAIGMMILTFYLTLKLDSEFFIAILLYLPVGLFGLFAKSKTLYDCFYGLKH